MAKSYEFVVILTPIWGLSRSKHHLLLPRFVSCCCDHRLPERGFLTGRSSRRFSSSTLSVNALMVLLFHSLESLCHLFLITLVKSVYSGFVVGRVGNIVRKFILRAVCLGAHLQLMLDVTLAPMHHNL